MTDTETDMLECTVEEYLCDQVEAHGGGHRKMQYIGRRGCSDQFIVFPWNRIFMVETKRPKGGKISIHQEDDAKWLLTFGVLKVYLFTKYEVDAWIRKVCK